MKSVRNVARRKDRRPYRRMRYAQHYVTSPPLPLIILRIEASKQQYTCCIESNLWQCTRKTQAHLMSLSLSITEEVSFAYAMAVAPPATARATRMSRENFITMFVDSVDDIDWVWVHSVSVSAVFFFMRGGEQSMSMNLLASQQAKRKAKSLL